MPRAREARYGIQRGPCGTLKLPKKQIIMKHLKRPFQMLHSGSLSGPFQGPLGTILSPLTASRKLQNTLRQPQGQPEWNI